MKIFLVGVELFHADGQRGSRVCGRADQRTGKKRAFGQTDTTKLTYPIRSFVQEPKAVKI
jgi:hypothetical protein